MKNTVMTRLFGGGASSLSSIRGIGAGSEPFCAAERRTVKSGFTLAEVLITLGIIGVVAAMTLPSIIQKKHKKDMEVAFKKAYGALETAVYSLSPDTYASYAGDVAGQSTVFFDDLMKKYKILKTGRWEQFYAKNNKIKIKTYTLNEGSQNNCVGLPKVIMTDGSAIQAIHNCFAQWIVIDTNGPKKGPNAYGHDIFNFTLSDKGRIIPVGSPKYGHWEMRGNNTYCSKNSTNKQNGASCAYFAVSNTCPDDETKTYWECLP